MDEEETSIVQADRLCSNCKTNEYLKQFPNKFCSDCRQQFINFPIPKWIWLFSGGIVIIMLIGILRMPPYVTAALKIKRTEKAIEAKRYVTAQRELAKVIEVFPDNLTANGRMLVASAYNWDMLNVGNTYKKIENKKIEDNDLLEQINDAMTYIDDAYPMDSTLGSRINEIKNNPQALREFFLVMNRTSDPDTKVSGVMVSHYLYDLKEYNSCEEIIIQHSVYYQP